MTPPTGTQEPTPLTDAAEVAASSGPIAFVVPADFARQLERRLYYADMQCFDHEAAMGALQEENLSLKARVDQLEKQVIDTQQQVLHWQQRALLPTLEAGTASAMGDAQIYSPKTEEHLAEMFAHDVHVPIPTRLFLMQLERALQEATARKEPVAEQLQPAFDALDQIERFPESMSIRKHAEVTCFYAVQRARPFVCAMNAITNPSQQPSKIENNQSLGGSDSCGISAIGLTEAAPPGSEVRKDEDGERYRWLRSRDLNTIHLGGVFAGKTPDNVILNGVDLDAAIDAALSASEHD